MRKIELHEVRDLVQYERVREAERAAIIALKARRRLALGDRLSLLFENRATVLFQIQEMVRTERLVEERQVRDELETYNALVPDAGALSATLFIEIPDLHLMSQEQVRAAVGRFLGLDREAVWLCLGERWRVPAVFEEGHSNEEKMAAVHYLRFRLPPEARAALADAAQPAWIEVRHPRYQARADAGPELRAQWLADLAAD